MTDRTITAQAREYAEGLRECAEWVRQNAEGLRVDPEWAREYAEQALAEGWKP